MNLPDIANPVNPVFARHETFHPRFGWIKKGFDAAKKTPDYFSIPPTVPLPPHKSTSLESQKGIG
ncbi:hypothetical protein AM228_24585 [Planktothricoides sp. SR001]|nr:hypothetical protein AM228_24585 [Planktothricoides sp. SR001]